MLTGLLPVHEHLGSLIDTFEMEFHHLACRSFERLAIFAFSALEPAAASSGGTCLWVGCVENVPVVRQVDRCCFSIADELPTAVEEFFV